jgi:hypothetical protein
MMREATMGIGAEYLFRRTTKKSASNEEKLKRKWNNITNFTGMGGGYMS